MHGSPENTFNQSCSELRVNKTQSHVKSRNCKTGPQRSLQVMTSEDGDWQYRPHKGPHKSWVCNAGRTSPELQNKAHHCIADTSKVAYHRVGGSEEREILPKPTRGETCSARKAPSTPLPPICNLVASEAGTSCSLLDKRSSATYIQDAAIEQFLREVAAFEQIQSRGRGAIICNLVRDRHYGITTCADDAAQDKPLKDIASKASGSRKVEPQVAGSPLVALLTRYLVLDAIHLCGIKAAKTCAVMPAATGLTMAMVFLALRQMRPLAKYVVWSRIDQKSCFKAIGAAGLKPVVIELQKLEGTDALGSDVPAM
eukprot:1258739-Amphidinium_carterae.1